MSFAEFKYLSFDCYGTLIDWEQGILGTLASAFHNYESVSQADVLKSFANWEAKIESGPFRKYHEVLVEVQAGILDEFSLPNDQPSLLADSVGDWPPFADSSIALRHLQQHFKLAILSNVDNQMFAKTQAQLNARFSQVCTAEEIGAYKPSLRNFHFLLDKLDCPKNEILHVAQSLYHDHVPANELGIKSVWVNRPSILPGQGAVPTTVAKPTYQVTSMAELVQMLMPLS